MGIQVSKIALLGYSSRRGGIYFASTRMLMALWDLDLYGFQDISAFDRSQLLLSTGINIKSKCHDLKLFLDISVGLFVCFLFGFFLRMSSI